MSPALREFFEAGEQGIDPRGSLCLTFSVPSVEIAWLQLMEGVMNFGYPLKEDPVAFVNSMGFEQLPGLDLDSWQGGAYATLSYNTSDVCKLASFIDQLLIRLHGLDAEAYEIDVQYEYL